MTKQEREKLKNEVAMKDVLTRKIGKWSKFALLTCVFFGAFAVVGFTGMEDKFLNVSDSLRNILKWVGLIVAIPSGIFSILAFISYRNSKKHVLSLIDKLQGK